MSMDKKTVIIKIGYVFLLYFLAYNIMETSLRTLYTIYLEQNRPALSGEVFFSSIVLTITLLGLWKIRRGEIVLLILGEFIIFAVVYVYSTNPVYIILDVIGSILFVFALIKVSIFLLSKTSNHFMENLTKKKEKEIA